MNAIIKQKETGRGGLTNQTRDLLKWLEARYDICWWRNHQMLGATRGRPDFEVVCVSYYGLRNLPQDLIFIAIELKVGKGKLNKDQLREKERIERAGGEYFICYNIYEVAKIFQDLGMECEII